MVVQPIVRIRFFVELVLCQGVVGVQRVPPHHVLGAMRVVTVVPDIFAIVGIVVEDHLGTSIIVEDCWELDVVEGGYSVAVGCLRPELPGEGVHDSTGSSSK